jgi:hypothetical protein
MATQPQRARSAHRRGTKEPTLLPPPSDSPGNGAGSGGGHDCGINPTRDGAVPDGYIDPFPNSRNPPCKFSKMAPTANTSHELLVQQIPASLHISPTNTCAYLRLIVTQQATS